MILFLSKLNCYLSDGINGKSIVTVERRYHSKLFIDVDASASELPGEAL